MSDNYTEETRHLFKLLRNPAFRLIIVCYNHYSLVQRLVRDLQTTFPDRPFVRIDTATATYQSITEAFFGIERGLLLLDHFEDALKEAGDSLGNETAGMQADNERRRGITAGLNLRRDKLASAPNALLLLVPASGSVLYAKAIMEKMPDLWSFRSLLLDLSQESGGNPVSLAEERQLLEGPVLGAQEAEGRKAELRRLLHQIRITPSSETSYLATLWPQIANIYLELGEFEKALDSLRAWEQVADEQDHGEMMARQGHVLQLLGRFEESDARLRQARIVFEAQENKLGLVKCLLSLGSVQQDLGNLAQAFDWVEKGIRLAEEGLADRPGEAELMFELSRGYHRAGDLMNFQGQFPQALMFYEKDLEISKQLFGAYPQQPRYKNGLGIAYERIGSSYLSMGDLDKALNSFSNFNLIERELQEAYPQDSAYKKNASVSHHRLGVVSSYMGQHENALAFFEQYHSLAQELHTAFPWHVEYKSNLASSYASLAQTYQQLSLPEKAKSCLIQAEKILVELVKSDPDNKHFKGFLKNTRIELSRLQPKHPPMENPIDQVKRLLQEDKIEKALRMLLAIIAKIIEQKRSASHIDDLFNPAGGDAEQAEELLILLAARVSRANKALQAGTIDFEVNSQERNRVIHGILDNLHYFTKQRGDNQGPQGGLVQAISFEMLIGQIKELDRTLFH